MIDLGAPRGAGTCSSVLTDQKEIEGQHMGRIMAIDWGERRIGIALSDETRTIASPHTFLKRGGSLDKDLDRIVNISEENEVDHIIIGLPKRLDGTMGLAAEGVLQVVEKVQGKISIPIDTWDERLSTAEAEKALIGGDVSRGKRKQKIDQVAAALFLQAYLDSRS